MCEQINKWVSVRDLLPPENIDVLVWYKSCPGTMLHSAGYSINRVMSNLDASGNGIYVWNTGLIGNMVITYWQALPSQPQT